MKLFARTLALSGLALLCTQICRPANAGTYTFSIPHLPTVTQTASYSVSTTLVNGVPVGNVVNGNPTPVTAVQSVNWSWSWAADPLIPNDASGGVTAGIDFTYSATQLTSASPGASSTAQAEYWGSTSYDLGLPYHKITRTTIPSGAVTLSADQGGVEHQTKNDPSAMGSMTVGHTIRSVGVATAIAPGMSASASGSAQSVASGEFITGF